MKRIFTILGLLLLVVSPALAKMTILVLSAPPGGEAPAVYCSACQPSTADIVCEDLEGSYDFALDVGGGTETNGGNSRCESEWSLKATSGCTVNSGASVPANPLCTDEGNYAILCDTGASPSNSEVCAHFEASATDQTVFLQCYVYFDDLYIDDSASYKILTIYDNSSNYNVILTARIKDDSGSPKFYVYSQAGEDSSAYIAVAADTWYYFGLEIDGGHGDGNDTIKIWFTNGTPVYASPTATISSTYINPAFKLYFFGFDDIYYDNVLYIDNIKVDGDIGQFPTLCG